MTQEEKQLLLRDICGRLPYGVNCQTKASGGIITEGILLSIEFSEAGTFIFHKGSSFGYSINEDIIKPYLRPMSSMTIEEHDYYNNTLITNAITICEENLPDYLEFMYSHHFDYQGLIPRGLALEAPEGMYSTKTE